MAETKKNKRGQGEWSFTQRKGDKLWTARKQFGKKPDGKPNIKAFYGKSISEVRKKAKEYEASLAENRQEIIVKTTLYDYAVDWLKTYKAISVKSTTYDALEDAIETRLKPYSIAHMQLAQLTTQICQDYINELSSGLKYSFATIVKTYNTINSCLKHAENIGDIAKNPMAFVNLPSKDKVRAKKDIQIFSKEEVKLILQQSKKTYSNGKPVYYYGDIIIILLYTGMRIGECLGLRWRDVDFANNTVRIDNTIAMVTNRDGGDKRTVITDTSPKTKKAVRTVPLSNVVKRAFLSFKSISNYKDEEDYIVVSRNGNLASARNIRRTLDSILEGCGLKCKDVPCGYGLHSLRHTFVSILLSKGVNIKVISELIGHEKVSTTYNIYAHLMPDDKKNSISLLDEEDEK